ncbi:hypothetical protein FOZ60_001935 [Perkinsus olseni]|uniref:Solute carrier 29 (Nucleoside transporters), member n=2 Tax=Perkinsus olseni TaxID=32597 RepID=A0A7J6P1T1_PEROL|nr:hypothetical protein FOZ60_001935 [Perkinsus olseni]
MAFSCFGIKGKHDDEVTEAGSPGSSKVVPEAKEPSCDWKLKTYFCIIGCVALLGWNFILGELGALIDAFGEAYGTWVSLCYSFFINCGQLLLVYMGNRFKFGPRFYIGCGGMGISQILLAICAATWAQQNQVLGFVFGCIFVGIFGFANALMESSMFGLAALVTSECTEWIMIGEGIAGLLAWPVDRLCQAILVGCGVTDYMYPRMIFFYGLAMLANFACIPMYMFGVQSHPFMQPVYKIEEDRVKFQMKKTMKRPTSKVIKDIIPMAINVCADFTISFVVFPWTIFQMVPSALSTDQFGQLMTYCFQVFDTLGRFSPNLHFRISKKIIRYVSFGRVIFIVLFFLNFSIDVPPFHSDWWRFVVMAFFAFTNGSVATWSMIYGPQQVDQNEKEELEIAGYVMAFALILGIFAGSIIATIIQQCAYM